MGMRRVCLVVLVAALTVLAVGASSGLAGARHATKAATVSTRKVGKLGTILVNSKGFTLYMFVPDKQKKVTCKAAARSSGPR